MSAFNHAVITPVWPAPVAVHAVSTTRLGGVSTGDFAGLNLALHTGDVPARVRENRRRLAAALAMPADIQWLKQRHGVTVVDAAACYDAPPEADASWAFEPDKVCVVQSADCLPVLFCDRAGTRVAAAHAGWRGLCAGILERVVAAMQCEPADLLAWLGPAIGPAAFEVGAEVRAALLRADDRAEAAFVAHRPGHYRADLFMLARQRLQRAGVTAVYGGGLCSHSDPQRFFSYRRDRVTGRMASMIWLAPCRDAACERNSAVSS